MSTAKNSQMSHVRTEELAEQGMSDRKTKRTKGTWKNIHTKAQHSTARKSSKFLSHHFTCIFDGIDSTIHIAYDIIIRKYCQYK